MSVPAPRSDTPSPPDLKPVRASQDLHYGVALRLVSQTQGNPALAAKRLLATGAGHGIDLSLAFVTLDPGPRASAKVRQVCLLVPGSGRTAMVFLSEPPPGGDPGGPASGVGERAACLRSARDHARSMGGGVALLQALPAPEEKWAVDACRAAEFRDVGRLLYLRRPIGTSARGAERVPESWGEGVVVRRVSEVGEQERDGKLVAALDRTYIDTMDCPELCGLRETRDVLASHKSAGRFDPSLWYLVEFRGEPEGCLLLSASPEQRSVELVYLGISPALRGRGLAKGLLSLGLREARARFSSFTFSCAVDARNSAARALYERVEMRAYAERLALVSPA